jgi:hypothetical protein
MNIAIDVSGNGNISAGSSAAGSTDETRITFLEAYLISEQTATNLTVVQGPSFLQGESGSTVKHSSFTVPSCAAPGAYGVRGCISASRPIANTHIRTANHLRDVCD